MNPLTALLPSARDLRLPAAIGTLWFIFAWMIVSTGVPSPASLQFLKPYDFSSLAETFGVTGSLVTTSLVVYLLGIATNVLDPVLRRVVFAPWMIAYFLFVALPIVLVVFIVDATVFFGVRFLSPFKDHLPPGVASWLSRKLADPFGFLDDLFDNSPFLHWVLGGDEAFDLRIRHLARIVDRLVKAKSEALENFVGGVDLSRNTRILARVFAESGFMLEDVQGVRLSPGQVKEWACQVDKTWEERRVLVRTALRPLLLESSIAREFLYPRVYDLSEWERRLSVSMREVPRLLRADRQPLFEEWDRLDSESEFRKKVAVPVCAISLAPVLSSVNWGIINGPFSVGPHTWAAALSPALKLGPMLFFLGVGFAGVLLYRDGFRRSLERDDFILSLLANGKVETEAFRPTSIKDLRLRSDSRFRPRASKVITLWRGNGVG